MHSAVQETLVSGSGLVLPCRCPVLNRTVRFWGDIWLKISPRTGHRYTDILHKYCMFVIKILSSRWYLAQHRIFAPSCEYVNVEQSCSSSVTLKRPQRLSWKQRKRAFHLFHRLTPNTPGRPHITSLLFVFYPVAYRSVVKYGGQGQSGQAIRLFQAPRKISFTFHF